MMSFKYVVARAINESGFSIHEPLVIPFGWVRSSSFPWSLLKEYQGTKTFRKTYFQIQIVMSKELRAAGLVIYRLLNSQVEYLLLQTSYGEHHWTPPKGHVDPGESDSQTALRETEEESGFKKADLEITDFQKVLKYDVRGRPKTVVYWLALLKNCSATVKLSDEHQAFKWLPLDEACRLAVYPEMQELLRACDSFLSKR